MSKASDAKAKDRARMRDKGFVPKQIWAKPELWKRNFAKIKKLAGL